MFESVKNWLSRTDQHQADKQNLEAEAKQFKLPGENLPAAIKVAVFIGLAALNVRLFLQLVSGPLGYVISSLAVASEALALYSFHNFSRTAGAFRWVLGISGVLFAAFALTHATISFFDWIGLVEISESIHFYSRYLAFPLLFGLVVVATVAMGLTHPRGLIRFKQAEAHTRIVQGRAEVASEMELMRAQSVLDQARLDRQRERTRRESEYLAEVEKLIAVEERKRAMVAGISDPALRESLARELGVTLGPSPSPGGTRPVAASNWTQPRGNGVSRSALD